MRKKTNVLMIIGVLIITLIGCKNDVKKAETNEVVKPKVEVKKENSDLQINLPDIGATTKIKDIESAYKTQIKKVDAALPKLKKKQLKTMLFNVPNTPVTIWYANGKPVKIEYGVTDDSGAFDGVFQYYLKDGKLWYANQIFANYIFQNNELKYWLDENWSVNEIPKKDFKDAEKNILSSVNTVINQLK